MVRKILLFGTSGNPPTGSDGHSGIVEYFVSLRQFDEIWILPVYIHMFAAKRDAMEKDPAVTYDDRIAMCRLAFERHSTKITRVRVMRTEEEVFMKRLKAKEEEEKEGVEGTVDDGSLANNARTSTYDVVENLRAENPNVEFSFLVGTDTYRDLRKGKWRKAEELLNTLNFVIVDRLGVRDETEDLLAGAETHHPPMLTDISSTKIRNSTALELESTLAVDPPVLKYMREKRLYGFGRQTEVAAKVRRPWLIVIVGAGLVCAVGAVIVSGSRRRGGRVR